MRFNRRRRIFLYSLLGLGAAGSGAVGYLRYIEPRRLQVSSLPVRIPGKRLDRPLKILHLSDMHASKDVPLSFIEKAFMTGLAREPDLICLTGDFITTTLPERGRYLDILRKLSAAAPAYACMGNHDGGPWARRHGGYSDFTRITKLLEDAHIACLLNQSETVTIQGTTLRIIGLGDLWADDLHPGRAFTGERKPDSSLGLVLSHNPDSKEALSLYTGWDLMLCGHTHGGQLRLPLIGTPFAPVRDHRFAAGLNAWNGRWIYTSRGIGNLYGMRFNCPPEVSILELS